MSIGGKVEDMLVGCFCQKWALNIAVQQTSLKQKAEDQCICLWNKPNAQYPIHTNSKDTILTYFGSNIPSSGSACAKIKSSYK